MIEITESIKWVIAMRVPMVGHIRIGRTFTVHESLRKLRAVVSPKNERL